MRSKKRQKHSAKPKAKHGVAPSMAAAEKRTGLRRDTIQAAKQADCGAFNANGTVDCDILIKWLTAHPEIVKATENIPDIKTEKAFRAKADRQTAEVLLEFKLGNIVTMDTVRRVVIRLAKKALSKMIVIPDRVSQKYSLLTDAGVIREDLNKEIRGAFKELAEENVQTVLKEMLKNDA